MYIQIRKTLIFPAKLLVRRTAPPNTQVVLFGRCACMLCCINCPSDFDCVVDRSGVKNLTQWIVVAIMVHPTNK